MKKIVRNKIEIIGKKLGMTQTFSEQGDAIPVTVVELEDNVITEIRSKDKNGYSAVQIGAKVKKDKHLNKPQKGNLTKKNLANYALLKEFRVSDEELGKYKLGEKLDFSSVLIPNEKVDVTGTSIGKDFRAW